MASDERSSKWCFIIYPDDSAPDNWEQLLDDTHIRACYSPLHQPDEEHNKKHIHVILDFGKRLKSEKQIKKISQELLHGTRPFIIQDAVGYYEYLFHKNHPKKEQFEKGYNSITHMNGFDFESYQETSTNNDFQSLMQIIHENGYTEFAQIVAYCLEEEPYYIGLLR